MNLKKRYCPSTHGGSFISILQAVDQMEQHRMVNTKLA